MKVAEEAEDNEAIRTSYSVIDLSVDVARTLCPSEVVARSRNGFSDAVYRIQLIRGSANVKAKHTMVSVQSPFSVSQILIVESKPQLYALFPPEGPNTAFDTLAVCDLRTRRGAFRLGRSDSVTLRRFFRSRSFKVGSGTSSVEGIEVSQSPSNPSHDDVSRCEPAELEATEDTGAVWRWRAARVCDFAVLGASAEKSTWVMCAVRSCDALAIICRVSSLSDGM